MTRPLAWAVATVFALGSLSVSATDSEISSTQPDSGFASGEVRLPAFVAPREDLYPAAAARKLLQGSVGLEFQIDGEGRARILGQTFVDAPEFAENASEVLKRGRFRVPENWVQSGGVAQRFVVEVQFTIARGDAPCAKKPPHVADTEIILVCRLQPSRRKSRL